MIEAYQQIQHFNQHFLYEIQLENKIIVKKKTYDGLKFAVLCQASFIAFLGCMHTMGHRFVSSHCGIWPKWHVLLI